MILPLERGVLTHRLLLFSMLLLSTVVVFFSPEYWYNKCLLLVLFTGAIFYLIEQLPVPSRIMFSPEVGLSLCDTKGEEPIQSSSYKIAGFVCLKINTGYLVVSQLDFSLKDYRKLCSALACSQVL